MANGGTMSAHPIAEPNSQEMFALAPVTFNREAMNHPPTTISAPARLLQDAARPSDLKASVVWRR
jgi:hypothetical protein